MMKWRDHIDVHIHMLINSINASLLVFDQHEAKKKIKAPICGIASYRLGWDEIFDRRRGAAQIFIFRDFWQRGVFLIIFFPFSFFVCVVRWHSSCAINEGESVPLGETIERLHHLDNHLNCKIYQQRRLNYFQCRLTFISGFHRRKYFPRNHPKVNGDLVFFWFGRNLLLKSDLHTLNWRIMLMNEWSNSKHQQPKKNLKC